MSRRSFPWRLACVALCLLWACYFLTLVRTTTFGVSWHSLRDSLLAFAFFVLPIAVAVGMGLPWRRMAGGVLLVLLGSVLFAETFAGAQEWRVLRQHGTDPGKQTFVMRWAPFSDHHIAYVPGHGWLGND